jgi:Family of unknown function (DUF6079)
MKLAEIFETRIEEKIDPVIKVGEVQDEAKLASEIGAYVVTPIIEKYVDEFLEHFTDTFRLQTTEIGAWISGYFGSGKSHLAKVLAFMAENRTLQGHTASKRFEGRGPAGGVPARLDPAQPRAHRPVRDARPRLQPEHARRQQNHTAAPAAPLPILPVARVQLEPPIREGDRAGD